MAVEVGPDGGVAVGVAVDVDGVPVGVGEPAFGVGVGVGVAVGCSGGAAGGRPPGKTGLTGDVIRGVGVGVGVGVLGFTTVGINPPGLPFNPRWEVWGVGVGVGVAAACLGCASTGEQLSIVHRPMANRPRRSSWRVMFPSPEMQAHQSRAKNGRNPAKGWEEAGIATMVGR